MNKRKCVLGVLKSEEGLKIKEEMLSWLSPLYDVELVEVDPPNDKLFEYPFIKRACEKSIEINEPILYLHTKGAGNLNQLQKYVRDFWHHEFTVNADFLFSLVDKPEPLASARIIAEKNKICWFNGFVINTQAAAAILKVLKPHDNRYWFEDGMLREAGVKTLGTVIEEDSENAFREFLIYSNDELHTNFKIPPKPESLKIYVVGSKNDNFYDMDSVRERWHWDDVHDGENNDADNPQLSEGTCLYWMFHHATDDIVGLEHYRRYFAEKGQPLTGTRAKEILRHYDVILHKSGDVGLPMYLASNCCNRCGSSMIQAAEAVYRCFERYWPNKAGDLAKQFMSRTHWQGNMFIMRRTVMDEFCEWLFDFIYNKLPPFMPKNIPPRTMGYMIELFLFPYWMDNNGLKIYNCERVELPNGKYK